MTILLTHIQREALVNMTYGDICRRFSIYTAIDHWQAARDWAKDLELITRHRVNIYSFFVANHPRTNQTLPEIIRNQLRVESLSGPINFISGVYVTQLSDNEDRLSRWLVWSSWQWRRGADNFIVNGSV